MSYSFSDYKAVRTLLGVSEKELPDTELSQPYFKNKLLLNLHGVSVNLVTDYEAAIAEVTPSVDTEKFMLAYQLYTAAAMASFCLTGLPQFSPKSLTDGKAGFSRFADSPYRETISRIEAELAASLKDLKTYYGVHNGTPVTDETPRTILEASGLVTDPVTGV